MLLAPSLPPQPLAVQAVIPPTCCALAHLTNTPTPARPPHNTAHCCPRRCSLTLRIPQSVTVTIRFDHRKKNPLTPVTTARTTTTQVFKLCPEAFTFPAACVIASATSQRPRPHIVFCRCRITTRHLRSIANPSLGSSEKRLRAGRSRHTSPDIPAPTPADHLSAALPPGILSALLALPVRL